MRTDRELLELALAVMPRVGGASQKMVIDEIYARLAEPEEEPEGEPFMWFGYTYVNDQPMERCQQFQLMVDDIPLYRHPPKPTGLDQLLERIRFLEQQILEKNK